MKQIHVGTVPDDPTATVETEGWSEDTFFEFSVNGRTRKSPLWRLRMVVEEDLRPRGDFYGGERELLRGQILGDWFSDLSCRRLPGTAWITSHGLTLYADGSFENRRNEDLDNMAKMHYCYRDFYALQDRHLLLLETIFTRGMKPGEATENLRIDPILGEKGIRVITETGEVASGRHQLAAGAPCAVLQEMVGIRRLENHRMQIVLRPQIDAPGVCLVKGRPERIDIELRMEEPLEPRSLVVAGLAHTAVQNLKPGSSCIPLEISVEHDGIVPLVVLVEGDDWIAWKSFKILVLPSVLRTSDERFNGVIVESIRSILSRRIFNVIPEEEPRGEMRFPGIYCGRFLASANLAMVGLPGPASEVIGLYNVLLKRDGYLRQDYQIDGRPLENNAHFTFGTEGNDGLGFYLFQMGKLILANPSMAFDLDAVTKAVDHLQQNLHWNGLLDSQSEPEDFIISEHTAGNPYTQGICLSGLRIMQRALKATGAESLSVRCRKTADLLSQGLRKLYEADGYFSNHAYSGFGSTGIWDEGRYLSSYTALGPGTFALADEVQEYMLTPLIRETVDRVQRECLVPGRKLVMGDPDAVCLAYSQFGLVANLLALGRLQEAEEYLGAALDYAETTTMKYILPEMVYAFNRDWWGRIDPAEEPRKLRARYPWLYEGEQPTKGVFGLVRDSGNLIHIGYLLYVVDQMIGISNHPDWLWITPRMLPGWSRMSVVNHPTRFGPVSYEIEREARTITWEVEKPAVETLLFLDCMPSAPQSVTCNGEEVRPDSYLKVNAKQAGIRLPIGSPKARIELQL